ncbi:MAG TPA: class I SAM-dependent methyltransferase [Candidatus Dormibacteraeota bacterium]|nr:class I SAM-dependent methyltransferase [Candidatus Dormibacteraeota bacterium]
MKADVFEGADAYKRFIGRWSRVLAQSFVRWLTVPLQGQWLDVGCGTGSLTEAILADAFPKSVVGIDPSSAFIAHATTAQRDPRVSFRVGNAMGLEFASASFDAAGCLLVLNFVPDPNAAAAEMRRVVRSGGRVGACVWDYAGEMRMLRTFWDAARELDPAAAQLDEGPRFPIVRPDALRACFLGTGFQQVEVLPLSVDMAFTDFDDFWQPFLGGQGPAGAYAVSLSPEKRQALADRIRSKLSPEADGSIRMVSRAWAVKGTVP